MLASSLSPLVPPHLQPKLGAIWEGAPPERFQCGQPLLAIYHIRILQCSSKKGERSQPDC
jgi:hypothetical protein